MYEKKKKEIPKEIRDTKGTFHAKKGSIKDRNGMDLTETEDIKNRWQECTDPPASRLPTEPLRARATQHPSPKRQGSISHDTWSTLRGRERKSLCKRTCWPRPICLSLCNPSKTALGSVEREMFERPGPQFSPKPT